MSPTRWRPILVPLALVVVATGLLVVFMPGGVPSELTAPSEADGTIRVPPEEEGPSIEGGLARAVERAPAEAAESSMDAAGPPLSYRAALGGIAGRLVEVDGAPVPDTEVELVGVDFDDVFVDLGSILGKQDAFLPISKGATRSDDEGRFRFDGVVPRAFLGLGVDLGGPRATIRVVDAPPNSGEVADIGDVVLEPYVTLTGRVVDVDGAPVADARVRATDVPSIAFEFGVENVRVDGALAGVDVVEDLGRHLAFEFPPAVRRIIERLPIPTTRTGANGEFTIAGVPPGVVTIIADKFDFVTLVHGPVPTGLAGGTRSVGTLRLDEGDEIAGRVETHDGEAVAGAEVFVGPHLPIDEVAIVWPGARTAANGAFTLGGLADKDHVVCARRPGGNEWAMETHRFPGGGDVVLRFAPAYDVTLTVVDPGGAIVPQPSVHLADVGEAAMTVPGMMPFKELGAATGPYSIRHRDDGTVDISGLAGGNRGTFDLGQVAIGDDGKITIEVTPAEASGLWSGRFCRREFVLSEGETSDVRIDLLTGQLRGRVVEHETGAPLPFVEVDVDRIEGDDVSINVPTAKDGSFRVDSIPAGAYRVRVREDGYAPAVVFPVEVPPQGAPPPVEIRVRPATRVSGRVVLDGFDLTRRSFMQFTRDGFRATVRVERDGTFATDELQPGEYHVTLTAANADDWARFATTVKVPPGGSDDFIIELARVQ